LAGGLGSTSAPLAFAGGSRVQALSQALVMLVAFFLDSRFTSFVALPRAVFDPVRRAEIATHQRVLGHRSQIMDTVVDDGSDP
jgi:predicted aspartyl protease